jgi:hypothetical protein
MARLGPRRAMGHRNSRKRVLARFLGTVRKKIMEVQVGLFKDKTKPNPSLKRNTFTITCKRMPK